MKIANLGAIAEIERRSVAPAEIKEGETYVGLEHITSSGGFTDVPTVAKGELQSNKFRFDSGHILYGKLRPYLAKIASPKFSGVCSTDILPIRPGPDVDRSYLMWFLRSPEMVAEASRLSQGANLPRLSPSALAAFQVPLPPIEEQRRIASILDAADALRAKRQQAIENLDTLTKSIFIAMFGGGSESPVSPHGALSANEMGWPRRRILEVARIATGHTPDRKVSSYWDGEISWVNLNEIREFDGRICFGTRARITDAGVMNSSAVVLPQGTVCFSRTASIGFVTIMGTPMTTSQDFVNWICGSEINPRYLMDAFLMSREALRASSSGSTHKTIYMRDAERFSVLVPPRRLQDEYSDRVEAIQAVKAKAEASVTELDALFDSLQNRAFRGEL